MSILPMVDPLYVLEIKGYELIEALENGVSQYPKLEGRFPQVSGVSFTFDPLRSPGRRVIGDSIWVAGEPLDMHKVCSHEPP
jgi:5'-nucleotidase